MRSVLLVVCALVVGVLAVVAGAQSEPLLVSWAEDARAAFLRDVADPAARSDIENNGPLLALPVYQIKLYLEEETAFSGLEQIMYRNRSSMVLEAIAFQLLPNMLGGAMGVSDVRVNGQEAVLELDAEDSSIGWLRLPELLVPGATVFIELRFNVKVPLWGAHIDARFNYASGILKAAYSFPLIAFLTDSGWDVRRPPLLGEFSWREHALLAVEIDTLSEFKIVSTGCEVRRVTEYDRTRTMYIAGPANDFFWGGSYRFAVSEQTAGNVVVRCFAPPSVQRDANAALYYAREALLVFSSHLSPYPFSELDIMFADLSGGAVGAEFSGVFLLDWDVGDGLDDLGMDPFDNNVFMETVVVHEVAHQWFAVTVASDPIEEPWLDEGLAQLVTWLYFSERYHGFGYAGFESTLLDDLGPAGLSLDEPTPLDVSVMAIDPSLYQGVFYALAPLVLRDVILAGDHSRCWAGLELSDSFRFEFCGWSLAAALVGQSSWSTADTAGFADLVRVQLGDESGDMLTRWLSR